MLRYDLHRITVPLPAPYADPADSRGMSALAAVPPVLRRNYPLENFDLRLEDVSFSTEALGGQNARTGYRYLVATIVLKTRPHARAAWGCRPLCRRSWTPTVNI